MQKKYALLSDLAEEKNYDKYLDALQQEGLSKAFANQIRSVLSGDDEQVRIEKWSQLQIPIEEIKILKQLASPYYIGYGNPAADLLIVGQEKAFDVVNNPELLLLESINNAFQWRKIIEGKGAELEFNPANPREKHRKPLKANHTWSKYAILADAFYGIDSCSKNISKAHKESAGLTLFDKAFITEWNVVPNKKNSYTNLTELRKTVLSSDFFTCFKNIVFAIGSTKVQNQDKIKLVFPNIKLNELPLGNYGKSKERKIAHANVNGSNIILCNQLSGSAGWKNHHIQELGRRLREQDF